MEIDRSSGARPSYRFSLRHLLMLLVLVAVGAFLFRSFYPYGQLLCTLYTTAVVGIYALRGGQAVLGSLCLVLFPVIAVLGFGYVHMEAHPVPLRLLNRVEIGATQERVESILGPPTDRNENRWVYDGWTWCYITIYFSLDGTVESVVHDH